MRLGVSIVLFFHMSLFAIETDFDVAVVGTSPFSMLEAIYHLACNERVLILEAAESCGGAWKSIDICGIAHADLGCHQIGSENKIKEFFETYFGCKFICLDHPNQEAIGQHARCPNGFYFSGGCHELVSCLKRAIDSHPNALLVNRKLQSIFVDVANGFIEVSLGDIHYTTAQLKITPMSHFRVENPGFAAKDPASHYYHHLYLLIEDEAPSSFTYLPGIVSGMTRAMNLTPFVQLPRENLQLIAFQTQTKDHLKEGQKFFEALKGRGLLTANAIILDSDTYSYEQSRMNISALRQLAGSLVEVLDASNFANIAKQLDKWQGVMDLYNPSMEEVSGKWVCNEFP